MKFLSAEIVFLLLAAMIFFSSCGVVEDKINNNISSTNTAQANVIKDDVGELGKIINLPFEPIEVVWQENTLNVESAGNRALPSNEKRLVAVLQLKLEDLNRSIAQAEKYATPTRAVVDAESWFPVELIAQSQLSGDESLKGNSYAANDFFLESFNKGKFTHVADTDFIVLELTSF